MTPIDELFESPPDESHPFPNTNPRGHRKDITFCCYPLAHLPSLITKMKGKTDPDERQTLRYLVDRNYHAWFAEEGHSKTIPTHGEMTDGSCLGAGNITLSDDFTTIVTINHKSGDMKPSFSSIQWLLAILILNESQLTTASLALAKDLRLEPLTESGGSLTDEDKRPIVHAVDKTKLPEWVLKIFTKSLQEKLSQQPDAIRNVRPNPTKPIKRERSSTHPEQRPRKSPYFYSQEPLFPPPPLSLDDDDADAAIVTPTV